ncbi:lasso peptide biosynthesis PqqD family chaperone [Streptomyces netropsis]|uniref:lasso peptide biosynthesis PqqD family chaperone n=1 Tax=Streptomyces netropsis TaxID=55404 RepID=UPI0037B66D69
MTFTLKQDVTVTETEHGTVLLDQRRSCYFQLNSTGSLILRALLDNSSPEHAASVLTKRYGISIQQARTDVTKLLSALTTEQLATT